MLRCSVGWTQPASASQPCEAQRVCTSEAPAGSALTTPALGLARTFESPDKAHRTIPSSGSSFLPHLHRDCTRTIRSIFWLVFPAMTGIMAGACVRQLARNPKGTLHSGGRQRQRCRARAGATQTRTHASTHADARSHTHDHKSRDTRHEDEGRTASASACDCGERVYSGPSGHGSDRGP